MSWPVVPLAKALDSAHVFVDGDWVESKDQDPEGDVRLIQLADIGDGYYVDKSNRFLTSDAARRLKCTFLEAGDLLLARMPDPLGRACIFPGDSKRAVTVVDVCIIRPDPNTVHTPWLMHCINSPQSRNQIDEYTTGTTRQRISRGNLAKINVALPPLEEQRRIATILDQAETLRTQRRQALAHLDTLTQSLFLDMFGDSRKNPKLWPTAGVESVCELIVDCVNRTAPIVDEPTPYKMIRTTNVKAGKVDLSSVRYVTEDTFKVWNRRATPVAGDVILTREAPLGEAGILDTEDSVFLGQRLMLYRPAKKHLVSEYLLHSFLSPFLQDQFERHGSGSTVKHLPLPACRAFELRMPPLSLQQTFATRIQAIEALKATHRTALAQLDALFASLQQRAFAGEL